MIIRIRKQSSKKKMKRQTFRCRFELFARLFIKKVNK